MDSQPDKCSICRHVKINGRRCQSPALSGSAFCYYHRTMHKGLRDAVKERPAPLRPETVKYLLENGQDPESFAPSTPFVLPPIEDAESIQLAISLLIAAIVARQIGSEEARNILYSLQIASSNIRNLAIAHSDDTATLVRRLVRTADGQTIAAPGDDNGIPSEADRPLSALEMFLEEHCYERPTPSSDAATETK